MNGGLFPNPGMRFGVHCYGVKPANWEIWEARGQVNIPLSPDEVRLNKRAARWRKKLGELIVQPFNSARWAEM